MAEISFSHFYKLFSQLLKLVPHAECNIRVV